jgi:sulfoxide reductase catalytic subunit YedY
MVKIDRSEITPEHLYVDRRRFIRGLGALAAGFALGGCATSAPSPAPATEAPAGVSTPAGPELMLPAGLDGETPAASGTSDELGNPLSSFETVATYNNYYEFSLSKTQVAALVGDFVTYPWEVQVGGLAGNPTTFDLEDLYEFEHEERIYRLRCVEAWSMVVPWIGFPLSRLLEVVDPKPEAKYVRFETVYAPDQMPGQKPGGYEWPYVEGLRMDEAMHDLTILATGIYGKPLLAQNGAPVRLVVPWKYGFKYIKSIVKIDLVDEMPTSFWMAAAPHEYGFYANVNPNVPHPRWSQATERLIGESGRRETLMFNGYEEEVAHLYEGMDLTEYY